MAPLYTWLVEDDTGSSEASGSQSSAAATSCPKWKPLRPSDSALLEVAFAKAEDAPSTVAIECGRYDVDLQKRILRAAYWDQPQRRVLRSSWFCGHHGDAQPYPENDAEELEAKFQRLKAGKERLPLLVPVSDGQQDVRFELLPKPELSDDISAKTWVSTLISRVPGAQGDKRRSIAGKTAEELTESDSSTQGRGMQSESVGDETQWYTAQQESVSRQGSTVALPVWRGFSSAFSNAAQEFDEEAKLPPRVECLVFVIHGIGQYHRSQLGGAAKFYEDVAKVRELTVQHLRRRQESSDKSQHPQGRIEFLPLEWYESIHIKVGIGNRLRNVTLASVPALRDFANFALADVMVYQDDEWRERIHKELLVKMKRLYALFKSRTPEFSGEVGVIGHSLGSVIMFDLMQNFIPSFEQGLFVAKDSDADSPTSTVETVGASAKGSAAYDTRGCPAPRCFFAIGSPLGMLMSIRLSRQGERAHKYFCGLDVKGPPACVGRGWRFFNVFHPDDPIAYRIEPLLNTAYTDVPPKTVPHYGGLRLHHQVREWWRNVNKSTSAEDTSSGDVLVVHAEKPCSHFLDDDLQPSQSAEVDRLDYAIQQSAFESMNEFLSAIHSHFAYWGCEDLVHFIADNTLDAVAAKQRPSAGSTHPF